MSAVVLLLGTLSAPLASSFILLAERAGA